MNSWLLYKYGLPIALPIYYLFRLYRMSILGINIDLKFKKLYRLSLYLGCFVSVFFIIQTFFVSDLVDYLSLLYVNVGVLFIIEIIATFKTEGSSSYNNAKVFRYYLYFVSAILLWMIFN